MLKNILLLELRKHWKAFLSTLLVILLGVVGPALGSVLMRGWKMREALVGSAAFLVLGLPLVAVLFGSQSGLGIRREAMRNSEEVLPVYPFTKVLGAYFASLLYFLAIGCLIFQTLSSVSVFEVVYAWLPLGLIHYDWLFLNLLRVHFLAFALTYWLKLPVLGSGLALIVSGIDAFFTGVVYVVSDTNLWWLVDIYRPIGWIIPMMLMAWGIAWAGLFLISKRVERSAKIGYILGGVLALMLLCGPVLSWFMVHNISTAADKVLDQYGYRFWDLYWDQYVKDLPGHL